jgi:hypothetical protein
MKRLLVLPLLGAALALAPSHSTAQTTNTNVTAATFEVAQPITFALSASVQSTSGTASLIKIQAIATKNILNDLGSLLGTNLSGATLVAVTPLGTTNQTPDLQVRRGTNIIADVSSFFTVSQLGTPVVSAKSNGQITTIDSITEYNYTGTNITFDVQGFTTSTPVIVNQKGVVVGQANQVRSTVAGSGTVGVAVGALPAVVQGTISLSGRAVEPVPTTPGRR